LHKGGRGGTLGEGFPRYSFLVTCFSFPLLSVLCESFPDEERYRHNLRSSSPIRGSELDAKRRGGGALGPPGPQERV